MNKKFHFYLIYLSLVFLLAALYRNDYLVMPKIYSAKSLAASFILLFGGFLLSALSQQRFLTKSGFPITTSQSITMVGLNIFTKYIPGKIMMVMGKGMHLSETKGYPLLQLSVLFTQIQIVTLWCGLMLALGGFFFHDQMLGVGWIGISLFGLFSVVIFYPPINALCKRAIDVLLRKRFQFKTLSITETLCCVHLFLGTWILWGGGFYFLASCLSEQAVAFPVVFCFPLAGTIGIIALFSPGGLGIRESIMVGYLTSVNVDLALAITISAVSRLWFLVGELFVFFMGYGFRER